jgi:hypothetical protein
MPDCDDFSDLEDFNRTFADFTEKKKTYNLEKKKKYLLNKEKEKEKENE